MKKIAMFLMCLVLCAGCLTGCTKNDGAFTEKNYTPEDEQITEVCIDVLDRKIEVTASNDNKIHLNYFENDKEYYQVSISNEHVLTMTATSNKELADYMGVKSESGNRVISLQIPNKLLSTLRLSTTNETISLNGLTVTGDVLLSTNGGNLEFDNLNAGNAIKLKAKNGDINGSIIGGYDDYMIACDIKKGENNLPLSKEGGEKTLDVSNNNGNIDIEFVSE